MAAGPDHGGIAEREEQPRQPLVVGDGVIVDEDDVIPATSGDCRVAGGREPSRIGIGDDLHCVRKARPKVGQEGVVVVHHHHRLGGRRFLAENRLDTRDRLLESGGGKRADHHRGMRRGGSRARIRCCQYVYPIDRWLLPECSRLMLRVPSRASYSIERHASSASAHRVPPPLCRVGDRRDRPERASGRVRRWHHFTAITIVIDLGHADLDRHLGSGRSSSGAGVPDRCHRAGEQGGRPGHRPPRSAVPQRPGAPGRLGGQLLRDHPPLASQLPCADEWVDAGLQRQ